MPFNPAGLYSLVTSYFAEPGTSIRTEQHNPVFEDVASALSQVLVRDGRAPMVGPLNMNGFAITGVAAGNTPSSVATLAQAMPIGAVIDFAGPTAPVGWALCYGQAVSRTTYAVLFALVGTTYGVGDGSTTFNLPDLRGRGVAGRDDMGGTAANRVTTAGSSIDGKTMGAAGGGEKFNQTKAQLPNTTFGFAGTPATITSTSDVNKIVALGGADPAFYPVNSAGGGNVYGMGSGVTAAARTSTASYTPAGTVSSGGSGDAIPIMQPTLIMNKIIRVSYDD